MFRQVSIHLSWKNHRKTFSIKDIISDDIQLTMKRAEISEPSVSEPDNSSRIVFTPEAFEKCWPEFISQLNGEGSRIVSMFKSVKPEVGNDQTIRIHLSNATQKDTFVQQL